MSYAKYKDLGEKKDGQEENNDNQVYAFEIKNLQQKTDFIKNNILCVVKVWAEWCGPCKQIAGRYQKLAKQYSKPGFCMLIKQNIEDFKDSSGNFTELKGLPIVKGVPTFQFFMNGKYIDSIVGADLKDVENKIKSLLQLEQ
jgi:thioredoxin 1